MPTVRKGRKPALLRRVRKVDLQQSKLQSEIRNGESQKTHMEEAEPFVAPPWQASPWLLLDVRYFSRCPACGAQYNSQVQTYATNPLPIACQTVSHGKGPGAGPTASAGCRGTVPASAL